MLAAGRQSAGLPLETKERIISVCSRTGEKFFQFASIEPKSVAMITKVDIDALEL